MKTQQPVAFILLLVTQAVQWNHSNRPTQTAMPVLEVICSLIGWFCLYLLFCCAFAQRGPEWNCRLVTLIHGVVIVLLTAYVIFIDGPWPLTHAGQWHEATASDLETHLSHLLFYRNLKHVHRNRLWVDVCVSCDLKSFCNTSERIKWLNNKRQGFTCVNLNGFYSFNL